MWKLLRVARRCWQGGGNGRGSHVHLTIRRALQTVSGEPGRDWGGGRPLQGGEVQKPSVPALQEARAGAESPKGDGVLRTSPRIPRPEGSNRT